MGDGKRTFDWMGNLSLQTNRNLHRFLTIDTRAKEEEEEQEEVTRKEEEEVELSLGLSLGGRFGTDKEKLVRSSSIAGTFPIVNKSDQDDGDDPPRCRHRTLGRTASLPVETEEEWRKRKEVQTLRRMAAKRRRSEKQRGGGGLTPPALGFARWVPPRHQPVVANQFKVGGDSHQGGGGSSSGGSESAQGSSSCGEASPASDVAGSSSNTKGKENASNSERETPPKRHEKVEKRNEERGLNSIEDMPCVFTQGDGPNGRRIEGILYRYGKGEEVSIMCVCHGRFLSPAEFVEHAGIVDVVHPLKHIVVNPSSNSYL